MKKDVMLNLIGVICLITGLVLFVTKNIEISLIFTFSGVLVYFYNLIKKKD